MNANNNLEDVNESGKNDYNKLQKQFNVLYSENEKNISENDRLRNER